VWLRGHGQKDGNRVKTLLDSMIKSMYIVVEQLKIWRFNMPVNDLPGYPRYSQERYGREPVVVRLTKDIEMEIKDIQELVKAGTIITIKAYMPVNYEMELEDKRMAFANIDLIDACSELV
jgi:hypothetical protein